MLSFEALVYFLLFIYFEQIIPNDNGTHKHPLFFLKFQMKPKK